MDAWMTLALEQAQLLRRSIPHPNLLPSAPVPSRKHQGNYSAPGMGGLMLPEVKCRRVL